MGLRLLSVPLSDARQNQALKLSMIEHALVAWGACPGRYNKPGIHSKYTWSLFAKFDHPHAPDLPPTQNNRQGESELNPPDRGNSDMKYLTRVLFEIDVNEALPHCSSERPSGVKCICSRVMRSQVYRQLALAMRFHGANNQVKWKEPALAFVRAAWGSPEPAWALPCPPLYPLDVNAYIEEANPTQEVVDRFMAVLERVRPGP